MHADQEAKLSILADAVVGKYTREIPRNWSEPKHAALLKGPQAFIDDVVAHLSDDGLRGDPMPWNKTAGLFRMRSHELTLWAGSNGSFKSTILSEIMLSLASMGRRVVVISLEMPAHKVAAKMAIQAFCNRHPSKGKLMRWAESLGENLCFLDFTGDLEPAEAIKLARYCAHELNTQHILIDNLTKIVSADNEHTEQQRKFLAQLHRTAIETGMHVHLVAHTRKPNDDESEPPGRYEVAGSRTLVDQPDNVVTIWRNRAKEKRAESGDVSQGAEPDMKIFVAKQRHGDFEGRIGLWTRRDSYRFVDDWGCVADPYWKD